MFFRILQALEFPLFIQSNTNLVYIPNLKVFYAAMYIVFYSKNLCQNNIKDRKIPVLLRVVKNTSFKHSWNYGIRSTFAELFQICTFYCSLEYCHTFNQNRFLGHSNRWPYLTFFRIFFFFCKISNIRTYCFTFEIYASFYSITTCVIYFTSEKVKTPLLFRKKFSSGKLQTLKRN